MSSRKALIIATGKYKSAKLQQLRAPAKDADALAGVLEDPRIVSLTWSSSKNELEWVLSRKIASFFAGRRRDDLLLLHMSCHELKDDEGNLFFAASDRPRQLGRDGGQRPIRARAVHQESGWKHRPAARLLLQRRVLARYVA